MSNRLNRRVVVGVALLSVVAAFCEMEKSVLADEKGASSGVDRKGKLKVVAKLPGVGLWTLAFSPDGKTIAGGGSGRVFLWDAHTGKFKNRFDDGDLAIEWIAFSADGKTLASASSEEQLVTIRTLPEGKLVRRIKLPGRFHWAGAKCFPAMMLSHDGKTVFTVMQRLVDNIIAEGGDDGRLGRGDGQAEVVRSQK